MHAGRLLNQKRKHRDSKRYAKILNGHHSISGHQSHPPPSALFPVPHPQSPTPSQAESNDNLFFDKLEERRKSIAVERERSHINLLHIGLMLLLIGIILVVIGFIIESYPTIEVGLVALLFGLYVTIGCGCKKRKKADPSATEPFARACDEDSVEVPPESSENTVCSVAINDGGKLQNVQTEHITPSENEKHKPKAEKIVSSKPTFDIIPEDDEEEELERLEKLRSSYNLHYNNTDRPPTPTPSVTILIEDFSNMDNIELDKDD